LKFERIILCLGAATLLGGCHLSQRLNPDCHVRQEYQQARQVAPLKVPEGLDAPNTQGALLIPAIESAPPPPGPNQACLDVPPKYKAAAPNKAGSSG
jgi:uncharacterized lipoprotein